MKLLFITLSSDENELDECIEVVSKTIEKYQYLVHIEHLIFRGLGRHEADTKVYNTIMENRAEYDYFVKLDADMKFNDDFIIKLDGYLKKNPDISHLVIPVFDYLSQHSIIGLHIFNNNAHWPSLETKSRIRVDPDPVLLCGRKVIDNVFFVDDIIHCYNPSETQAMYYGMHRGMKFFGENRTIRKLSGAYLQFQLAERVRNNFVRDSNSLRRAFMVGFYQSSLKSTNDVLDIIGRKKDFNEVRFDEERFLSFLNDQSFWFREKLIMRVVIFISKVWR
ncbi:hypothetical protein L4C54_18000 [Vibrio lamellibrachiae]|uniref:hypothetical protein n=1 Tax=Vibrio lamellibrachiae TaxID=2910253 RepID=UPI003D0BF464